MTGSPNKTSRLDEFLAAAKGESAHLAARKAKPLHPFSIRLTQEERERLELEAKGKPLSVYMRERLLRDGSSPRKLRRKPAADQAGLAKVLGMLGQSRVANNLNQIAKAAHIGVLVVSPALIEELENACRDIRVMRDALLSALGLPRRVNVLEADAGDERPVAVLDAGAHPVAGFAPHSSGAGAARRRPAGSQRGWRP